MGKVESDGRKTAIRLVENRMAEGSYMAAIVDTREGVSHTK